ncbi:twin-arginine translocase TatA/TatE family subunit [Marinivivus vitaminiproducens]|uniref:twin-arginine translocase TatA/TatE family subunit n=1 Tax=Marinivivus vitaminiproducens TaxID=3035935 RepID=UPI00279C1ACB|nr:twin-arginine translocase TatA/TatE family subunit [Geminicoccaceae bacterium SCSIO 64248]
MGLSFSHLALVAAVVLLLFGSSLLPRIMGDLGRAVRSLKGEPRRRPAPIVLTAERVSPHRTRSDR